MPLFLIGAFSVSRTVYTIINVTIYIRVHSLDQSTVTRQINEVKLVRAGPVPR